MSASIHIGTSGWSYDDWVGPFYPDGTGKSDYLVHYATAFDAVEVDSTFYRTPGQRMVQGWADKTPAGFRFALKVPQVITHEKMLADCEREMDQFVGALAPLGDKLRCVLLQFGYFNKQKFSSAAPFFKRLDAFLHRHASQVPIACEIRNKNWLGSDYFELLRGHAVAAALVEHAWLPRIDQLVDGFDVVTGPFSYVRLIGDRQGIEEITRSWGEVVIDRSKDLARVAGALRKIASRAELLVFINNHYAGHGPATCRELVRVLNEA
jgi:uncharacterized protein YecE (DUF72 family)